MIKHYIAVTEWESKTEADEKLAKRSDDAILNFFIPRGIPAICEGINNIADADKRLKTWCCSSKAFLNAIYDILDNNERDIPPDALKTLNTICNLIQRFQRVVDERSKRFKPAEYDSVYKGEIDNVQEEREQHIISLNETRNSAEKEGKRKAKEQFIKEMLSKYDSVWSVMENDSTLSSFLSNLGVSEHDFFVKGAVVEISDDDIEKCRIVAENLEACKKYRVVHSAYILNGKVLDGGRAILEIYEETPSIHTHEEGIITDIPNLLQTNSTIIEGDEL